MTVINAARLLDDDVARLSAEEYRFWTQLHALSDEGGVVPSIDELASALSVDWRDIKRWLAELTGAGLLLMSGGAWWLRDAVQIAPKAAGVVASGVNATQKTSMTVAERVRKHRAMKRQTAVQAPENISDVTKCNAVTLQTLQTLHPLQALQDPGAKVGEQLEMRMGVYGAVPKKANKKQRRGANKRKAGEAGNAVTLQALHPLQAVTAKKKESSPRPPKEIKNIKNKNIPACTREEFLTLAGLWPRANRPTTRQEAALTAYQGAITAGHAPELITAAAKTYLRDCKGYDARYVKTLHNWLKDQKFIVDDPPATAGKDGGSRKVVLRRNDDEALWKAVEAIWLKDPTLNTKGADKMPCFSGVYGVPTELIDEARKGQAA